MIGAVERVIQGCVDSACNRNRSVGVSIPATGRSGARERCRRRASCERDQIGDLPSVQWKVQDARIFDNLTDTHVAGFHQRRIRLYFDLLRNLADFQNRIDSGAAVDLQYDARLNERSKTRQARFEAIGTKRQARQDVRSGFIRDGTSGDACFRLRHTDFDSRQHRAALILRRAADLCSCLRPNRGAGQTRDKQSTNDKNENTFH